MNDLTPHRAYADALGWVANLMCSTPVTAMGARTPCAEFDVRGLMGHLLGTAERGLGTAERRSTRGIPHVITDVPDGEVAVRYAALGGDIGAAWATVDEDEDVVAPWGSCRARDALRGFTIETLVHGWDLAVATGQPCEAPAGLATSVIDHVSTVVPERLRGVMYADPQAPPAGAGPTERLSYLLGHRR